MTTRADRRGLLRRAYLYRQAQPFSLDRFYVSGLPRASLWQGAQVHVVDEVGGACTAYSDGTYWRRVTDLVIVSAALPTALYSAGVGIGTLHGVAGPYMRSNGAAVGTAIGAAIVASDLSASGTAVATMQTPPRVPADIDADGIATGTLATASIQSAALSATGAGTAIGYGVAA